DANPGDRNTGSFNGGSINTGFANAGNLNTGSFNTGNMNLGSFHLADSQGVEGFTIPIDFPAIPIDLVAGTNVAIPVTGFFYPITIQPIPQFGIPVDVSVTVLFTINVEGILQSPVMDPIVVNPIVLKDLMVGADIRIPIDMTLLGRLNVTVPGLVGIGNSAGSVSSGYFNGNSSGTSGFFNSSDLSSGFANANGALTSGWYNSGSLLSGWQNLGTAISGVANTSTSQRCGDHVRRRQHRQPGLRLLERPAERAAADAGGHVADPGEPRHHHHVAA
ncbi:pentapeptide repeat-containing protein, partial [Mycobacterium gordonae]|uniref:pentapeptide repeat-containing protein n=1 Tax=Mycobacterium gordonae TaxID=1778 RepID=UPI000A169662